MNGGHILLGLLLVAAIAEIIYTQGCLRTTRGQLAAVKKERDVARSQIGIKDNVTLLYPGMAHPVCESCGNEDATYVVCTECMTIMPDPAGDRS